MSGRGNAVAAAAGPGGSGAGDAGEAQSDWRGKLLKGIAIYMLVNAASNFLLPKGPQRSPTPVASPDAAGVSAPTPSPSPSPSMPAWMEKLAGPPPVVLSPPSTTLPPNSASWPLWPPTSELDFYVFLSHSSAPDHDMLATQRSTLAPGSHPAPPLQDLISFDLYPSLVSADPAPSSHAIVPASVPRALPVVKFGAMRLDSPSLKSGLTVDLDLQTPDEVMFNNGSIWADIVAVGSGVDVRTTPHMARTRKLLTRLYPQRRHREERRLLGGGSKAEEEQQTETPPETMPEQNDKPQLIGYWHRNLTIGIAEQNPDAALIVSNLPPPLLAFFHVVKDTDGSVVHAQSTDGVVKEDEVTNYPVVFPNTFWDMREDMYPVNRTTPTLPLHISLYSTTWFRFQLIAAMTESFEKQPGMASGEIDIIKHTLLHTNPYYIAFTVFVSMLHMLFEFLAFSSDVKFWRNKKNFTGVSVGSILTNVITQTIILLYLFDSSEETSWVILGSQAVGVGVEAWKITSAVTISLVYAPPGSVIPYRLDIKDKYVPSEDEIKTKQYDREAFRLVSYFVGPLLVGYTIYSAVYEQHRGWWSFTIGTLTSFVYAFGFIALVPSLIINYRCKSVAGMSPKTLMYKITSTFIDDLFAFGIVKMPTLHRLATLRDDVVFFIYLYQWWIYGSDTTRVNELGEVVDPDRKVAEERKKLEEKKEGAGEGKEGDDKRPESRKDR